MTTLKSVHLASVLSGIAMLGAAAFSAPATAAPPDNSHNPALPQYNVTGTDYMLYGPERAEDASQDIRNARGAISRCDRPAFSHALAVMRNRSTDGGGMSSLFVADTEAGDTDTLGEIAGELYAEWANRCGEKKADAAKNAFTVSGGFHAGRVNVPKLDYLGFEDATTFDQTTGVVNGEDDGAITGASIQASIRLFQSEVMEGPAPTEDELDRIFGASDGVVLRIGAARSSADVSSEFTNIDPDGNTLLIPGPQGGASGFALPSAGGANVVSQADFSAEYDWTQVYSEIDIPIVDEAFIFIPSFGVEYVRTDFDVSFDGSIPGFARDFAYDTNVDVDAISPTASLEVVRDFGGYSLRAGGLVAVNFNDADGRDRLSFTGFPDSEAKLENDDTTVSGRIWAGVTYGTVASPFKLSLDLAWIHTGNVPDITRDGTNPSRLDLDNADAIVGALSANISF